MKRILPIIIGFISLVILFYVDGSVYAQTDTSSGLTAGQAQNIDNQWIIDPEVTAIGKNASRAGLLLDWALRDYNWSYTTPGTTNSLLPFWATLRNFVYSFMVVLVVAAAIVMLVTRGRSLTIRRFIPRFIIVAILVTFSFSLVQVIYELVDIFQGFFVRPNGVPISQRDLLSIGWNYDPFLGLRLLGDANFEAAFTTLIFVKLTTFTYYVMVGILLIRKVILWFFIIISPFFPLLLFFYPLRNTAKIWIGEFFRWLLYAPLFAIFLAALVSLWKTGIPLSFNFDGVNTASAIIFPTAVSILLGGPGQAVGQLNNLNVVDTYAQYIVALMMLWSVIIVPWILLQIFLDYMSNVNVQNAPFFKNFSNYLSKPPIAPSPSTPPQSPVPPGGGGAGTGRARTIPLIKDFKIPTITGLAKPIPRGSAVNIQQMTKLSVPTIRDIAKMESASIQNSEKTREESERVRETLTKIANPSQIRTEKERSEYEKMRETLQNQSLKGDKVAASILNAANTYSKSSQTTHDETTSVANIVNQLANPQSVRDSKEREQIQTVKERIQTEAQRSNPLAQTLTQVTNTTQNITNVLNKLASHTKETEVLRERIEKESRQGNSLATTIMSAVQSVTNKERVTQDLMSIHEPSRATDQSQRQQFTRIQESLRSEKEKGSEFATHLTDKLERLSKETNSEEKEKLVTQIRESLTKEKESGNPLATLILSQVQSLSQSAQTTDRERVTQTLMSVQEPSRIQDQAVRQQYTKLKETIRTEKDKGNEFASQLTEKLERLSQETNSEEKEKLVTQIRESVIKENESGNPLAALLLNQVQRHSEEKGATSISELNKELTRAKQEGNPLATELLSLAEKESLSETEAQDLEKKVDEAKKNGDPLGVLLSDLLTRRKQSLEKESTSTALPSQNRIQQVSLDDYEAVKKMWTESYENLDVPGVENATQRTAWIKDDVSQISETIDLLSSQDSQKVQEGMDKVSEILPFLLIGGFSQGEIVAYLKAKMEAAKGVLSQVAKVQEEEDTQVFVERKKTAEPKKMSVSQEVSHPSSTPSDTGAPRPTPTSVSHIQSSQEIPQTSTSLLRLANISVPDLKRLTQYDKMLLSKKEDQNQDIRLMHETLRGVANPSAENDSQKREYYRSIRGKLLKEVQEGSTIAPSVLAAGEVISSESVTKALTRFAKLSSLLTQIQKGDVNKILKADELKQLTDRISYEASRGNDLAKNLDKAISGESVLNDPLQKMSLISDIENANESNDALAKELVRRASSLPKDTYEGTLLRTYRFLQNVSDSSHLAPEKKKTVETLAEKITSLKAGNPTVQNIADGIDKARRDGIDFSNVIQLDAHLTSGKDELLKLIPELAVFLNEETSQPVDLKNVVTTVVKPEAERSNDPFVQKLVSWGEGASKTGGLDGVGEFLQAVQDPGAHKTFAPLSEELQKQKNTSQFAQSLLTLSGDYARGKITRESLTVLLPALLSQISDEARNGNQLALHIQDSLTIFLEEKLKKQLFKRLLLSLSDPAHLPREKKDQIMSLRTLVISEKEKGNTLASQITEFVNKIIRREPDTNSEVLTALYTELLLQKEKGSQLARALLSEVEQQRQSERLMDLGEILKHLSHIDSVPEPEKQSFATVRSDLETLAQKGDADAMSVLSAIEIIKEKGVDLGEVRKVADLMESHSSSVYSQRLLQLCATSLLSHSTLSLLIDLLGDIGRKENDVTALSELLTKTNDAFSKQILSSSQNILNASSFEEKFTIAQTLMESLLTQTNNAVATEVLSVLTTKKLQLKTDTIMRILELMASPDTIQLPEEKEKVEALKKQMDESVSADPFARLLSGVVSVVRKDGNTNDPSHILPLISSFITREAEQGDEIASHMLSQISKDKAEISDEEILNEIENEAQKGNPVAQKIASLLSETKGKQSSFVLPKENKLQSLSLEDYESVKRMWLEGYKSLDVPGSNRTREEWLSDEVTTISETIALLTSTNPDDNEKGLENVSYILPILLIGGFTQTEVASYLKAKLEAAKTVLHSIKEQNEEKETQV